MSRFGPYFKTLLTASRLTQAEFARRARTTRARVAEVLAGDRNIPYKHMERWADALNLEGDVREIFLDRAALSHAHERVQRLVERLQRK